MSVLMPAGRNADPGAMGRMCLVSLFQSQLAVWSNLGKRLIPNLINKQQWYQIKSLPTLKRGYHGYV